MLTQSLAHWRPWRRTTLGLVALLLLTTVLTGAPATAAPPTPAALIGSVDWDPNGPVMISNGGDVAYPWSTVDSNNVTHVIYMTTDGGIWYANNRNGAFQAGTQRIDLASTTPPAWPFASIAAGPNNVLHMVYQLFNKGNQIFYRRSENGGQTWSAREQISNDAKSASPDLAVDSENNAYIVWVDNRCGGSDYNIYFRIRLNSGIKSGTEAPKGECGTFQNRPQITVIGGVAHVVFQHGNEVYYARRDPFTSWSRAVNISESSRLNSLNATIASDGVGKLFVAWDEGVSSTNHDIKFRTSFDAGVSWSNAVFYSSDEGVSTYPDVVWSETAKRAFIVWQDDARSDDDKGEIWEREFDPASLDTTEADQISHFTGRSQWPTIGAGPNRTDIVWMDEVDKPRGFFQVWDWAGLIKGNVVPPTGCNGTLRLNGDTVGGVKSTDSITLTGTITPETGCVPDQMQISLNEPITSATPKVAYSANLPPLVADADVCAQTVYVRLLRNNAAGTAFSDTINVDTGVDAIVQVSNPHMLNLPDFPDSTAPGTFEGDPNYTREPKFFFSINDAGDCTGLTTFVIPSIGSGAITNGAYQNWFDLPNITTAGPKEFFVNVSDGAGHTALYPQSIVYDPNPPVLHATANTTATAPLSTTSILVPLAFDGINVTDDQYGPDQNLPANAEFWGVLVANSTTNVTPDNPGLEWFPVQTPNASSTFTVTWNLITGLGDPPAQDTGGDVYVYVRFVDGAGNITTDAIAVRRITLEPNYTLPTLYLPIVGR